MERFHINREKVKKLKIRKGFPLFINFCYNQKIRYELNNSKLFVDELGLHYNQKYETGGGSIDNVKSSKQSLVKEISDYLINNDTIIIKGIIEQTKDGDINTKKVVNELKLYRIYSNENKILEYLKNNKVF